MTDYDSDTDRRTDHPWRNPDILRELHHDDELTMPEIADRLGCSRDTVKEWMDRHDIETVNWNNRYPDQQDHLEYETRQYHDPEWLREQHVVKGRFLSDIADECGVSSTTIGNYCDRHDIPKRGSPLYPPRLNTNKSGYERFAAGDESVAHHRLLAIANGVDPHTVFNGYETHIHHENGNSWDNRPVNLSVYSLEDHVRVERMGSTDAPWTDPDSLKAALDGATTEMAADELGCSPTCVREWKRRLDVERDVPVKPWRDESRLRAALSEHHSLGAVGDALGCTGSTVSTWLDNFNISSEEHRRLYEEE